MKIYYGSVGQIIDSENSLRVNTNVEMLERFILEHEFKILYIYPDILLGDRGCLIISNDYTYSFSTIMQRSGTTTILVFNIVASEKILSVYLKRSPEQIDLNLQDRELMTLYMDCFIPACKVTNYSQSPLTM